MSRSRFCRVCSGWHDTDDAWPDKCLNHFRRDAYGVGPTVIRDIEPYQAVAAPGRPVITSRRHHRDMLRAHGLMEVGNDKMPERRRPLPGNLKNDIAASIEKLGG